MKLPGLLERALFRPAARAPEPQFYDWEVHGECDNRSHPLILEEEENEPF